VDPRLSSDSMLFDGELTVGKFRTVATPHKVVLVVLGVLVLVFWARQETQGIATIAKDRSKGKDKSRKMRKSTPTLHVLEEFAIDLE
jgi:hypothetical protein